MKKIILGTALLALSSVAFAHSSEMASKVITVITPQIKAIAKSQQSAEIFMQLDNKSTHGYELVAAFSPVAKQIQLHETVTKHGKTEMKQVSTISIKAKQDKKLQGSLHVMLLGVATPLHRGQRVPVTLIFKDGSWLTVNATTA